MVGSILFIALLRVAVVGAVVVLFGWSVGRWLRMRLWPMIWPCIAAATLAFLLMLLLGMIVVTLPPFSGLALFVALHFGLQRWVLRAVPAPLTRMGATLLLVSAPWAGNVLSEPLMRLAMGGA